MGFGMTSASSDDVLGAGRNRERGAERERASRDVGRVKEKEKDKDGDEVMDDEETEDGNTTTQARRPPPVRRRVRKAAHAGIRGGGRMMDDLDVDEERDIGEASDSDSDDERIVMKTRRSSTRVPVARKRDSSMDDDDDIELELAPADNDIKHPPISTSASTSALKFSRSASGRLGQRLLPPQDPAAKKQVAVGGPGPTGNSVGADEDGVGEDEDEEGVEHVVLERVERVELPRFRDFEAAALGGSSQAVTSLGMASRGPSLGGQNVSESSKMSIDSIVS